MQVSNNENAQTFGHVIVIRRNGLDGGKFPVNRDIMIGRHEDCHIRISLSTVSRRHTLLRIDENEKKVYLRNMSMTNPTNLNNKAVSVIKKGRNDHDPIIAPTNSIGVQNIFIEVLGEKLIFTYEVVAK